VYGTPEQIAAVIEASPVSATISTYGVERNNLTIRQHSRRVGLRVNAFSKERDYLEDQLTLAFAYYHFVVPHRGLRQRLEHPVPTKGLQGSLKKWRERTPAMAAGLTDHIWTMDELSVFVCHPRACGEPHCDMPKVALDLLKGHYPGFQCAENRLSSIQIFSDMHRAKIVHVLVDKLCNRDFGEITVCFVPDEAHRENIAQRRSDEVGVFADQELQPRREIFVRFVIGHVIPFSGPTINHMKCPLLNIANLHA
jgi:hypothetical protein